MDEVAKIPLTRGKIAIIDNDDIDLVSGYKWFASPGWNTFYAIHKNRLKENIRMHRLIMGAKKGQYIDHINGDGTDNRRSNLRFATVSQNAQNRRPPRNCSSKYKGVHLNKPSKKWIARIKINGKRKSLGYFKNESDAAFAYNVAAKLIYGEFSRLNVLDGRTK